MEKKIFKAAAANMDCVLGDVAANLKKMEKMCIEASKEGASAIVFPELAVTGYSPVLIAEKFYEISEPGSGTEHRLLM